MTGLEFIVAGVIIYLGLVLANLRGVEFNWAGFIAFGLVALGTAQVIV